MPEIGQLIIEPWYWMAFGAVLMILEIMMPGVLLFWFGAAGFLTGLLMQFVTIEVDRQALAFAVISFVLVIPVRKIYGRMRYDEEGAAASLNNFGADMIGRQASVSEAIKNGRGAVSLGDTRWLVRCSQDAAVGDVVRITGVESSTLLVERVDAPSAS